MPEFTVTFRSADVELYSAEHLHARLEAFIIAARPIDLTEECQQDVVAETALAKKPEPGVRRLNGAARQPEPDAAVQANGTTRKLRAPDAGKYKPPQGVAAVRGEDWWMGRGAALAEARAQIKRFGVARGMLPDDAVHTRGGPKLEVIRRYEHEVLGWRQTPAR